MILTILDPRSGQKVTNSVADVPVVQQAASAKAIPHPRFVTGGRDEPTLKRTSPTLVH